RDLAPRAAQDERVKEVVGDEATGGRVVLFPPRRRDAVAQLGLEARAPEGDVGEDAHHVDDERLALRAVERVEPRVADEREQVARDVEIVRIATRLTRGFVHHAQQLPEPGDRLRGSREVAIALLARQDHDRRAVAGNVDRNTVHRREHRLQRRQARLARWHPLAPPERVERVDRLARPCLRVVRRVWNAHLAEPQRERGPEAEADALRRDLVEGADRHRDEHRVTGERVERAEADLDLLDLRRDRRRVGHGIALEVRIVEPDRLESRGAGALRPRDRVLYVTTSGETQTHPTRERGHLARTSPVEKRLGAFDPRERLLLTQQLQRLPQRRTLGLSGDRDADRLGRVAHLPFELLRDAAQAVLDRRRSE